MSYYLKYADGLPTKELETKGMDYKWYIYDAQQEIGNEDFLSGKTDAIDYVEEISEMVLL